MYHCPLPLQQTTLVGGLEAAAAALKTAPPLERREILAGRLEELGKVLPPVFCLPLDPAYTVTGFLLDESGFFASKALPLRLAFKHSTPQAPDVRVIFKLGDDLRQDALVLQVVKLVNRLWIAAGLNLHVILYSVMPTSANSGFIEMVEAYTLRSIQTKYGLTGSFNNRILNEWLQHANPLPEAFTAARANFTASCAAYCVITYILGTNVNVVVIILVAIGC